MLRVIALAAGLACALSAAAFSANQSPPLRITHDLGGSVDLRLLELDQLRQSKTPVRIEGLCVSACTLYLGLEDICVTPQAKLGFHGPASGIGGFPLQKSLFEQISQRMADHYPKPLRRWFLKTGRHITKDYYLLSAEQVIKMGVRAC